MKHFAIGVLYSCSGFSCLAQIPVSKGLERLFRESSKSEEWAWTACNSDGAYSKRDTVRLVQYGSNEPSLCCEFVRWTFDTGKRFDRSYGHHCQEPPLNSIAMKDQDLKLGFEERQVDYLIRVLKNSEIVESFRLIALIPVNSTPPLRFAITMVRIRE